MVNFTKLQGNGNDFILIDEYNGEVISENEKSAFAEKYCHRRFGIGGDGVLYLGNSNKADIKMRIFNSDGTEAEMCGNGVRCIVKYAFDKGYIKENSTIETGSGILSINTRVDKKTWVKVNMGKPEFSRKKLPAKGDGEFLLVNMHDCKVCAVNTGVPHAVIFVETLNDELMKKAPKIRYDPIFPKGTNVNFVFVNSRNEITIRTYERGVEDETYSCGTGSVASAAVAYKLGKTESEVKVNTKGGELRISLVDETAFMDGPAELVFEGFV